MPTATSQSETATLAARALAQIATPGSAEETPGRPKLPPASPEWRRTVLGIQESHHPKVKLAAECAEKFIRSCLRDIRDGGTWFAVSGQTGCGKTHLAKRLANYYDTRIIDAWHRGWIPDDNVSSSVFLDWPKVASAKDWVFDDICENELWDARFVIIDDIGAESDRYKSGEPATRLLRVLNRLEKKWLFVTTNVAPSAWRETFDQRIADRLLGGAYVSMFEVPSWRTK